MSRINKSQFAILGWLSKGPMSGYDLKQKFAKVTPFHWTESNAQIYPILKKLEQDALVSSRLDESSGGRNRRIYLITSEGLDVLESWLKEPADPAQYREEMLLKLTMGEHLDPNEIREHIEYYHQNVKQQLTTLRSVIAHTNRTHADTPDNHYLNMTFDFAQKMLSAKDAWCENTLQQLTA